MPLENQREIFARAYSQAALADANMREVVAGLETIRDRMNSRASYHEVLSTIEEQIGQADLTRVVPSLRDLCKTYFDGAVGAEVARLKQAFEKDRRAGWQAWLLAYVQVFQEGSWRTDVARRFATDALVSSPDPAWPVERIRRHDWLITRERWPEAYEWFIYLSEQEVPAESRARLLAIAAEIQLYRFTQRTRAEALLERAAAISPGEHVAERARAEMAFEAKAFEDAKRRYQTISEKKPKLADGFLGLAECADAEGDPAAAEAFYQQAVRAAPGMTSAHRALMNWYAKRIDERESLILSMFKRVVSLSDDEGGECLSLGQLYKKVGRYQKAREWLSRALTLQPDNGLAEVWNGHNDRDECAALPEGPQRDALLASAEAHFLNDRKICPEGLDGPWGMMCVETDRKNWPATRTWCDRCVALGPEWESSMLVRRAQVSMELSDWPAAEQDLVRSVELEAQNPAAIDALLDLADRVVATDRSKAEDVIARWRKIKGDPAEYIYQNRLGNWAYNANDYETAAARYEKAVAANPDRPVLRSNYALAAAALRTRGDRRAWLDKAIASLTEAQRLDSAEQEYRERLAKLVVEREFIQGYGEKALELMPIVTPVRVDVLAGEVNEILDPEGRDLSKDTVDRINAWRTSFRTRYGLAVPGLSFTIAEGLEGERKFRLVIMERLEEVAETNGRPLLQAILESVEAFSVANIAQFLGHQEAANLLRAANVPAASAIIDDPRMLTGFVVVLRVMLAGRVPITDIATIARTYLEQHGGTPAAQASAERVAPLSSAQKG
jgi:tetratricopeptide (TPR) repeat protein